MDFDIAQLEREVSANGVQMDPGLNQPIFINFFEYRDMEFSDFLQRLSKQNNDNMEKFEHNYKYDNTGVIYGPGDLYTADFVFQKEDEESGKRSGYARRNDNNRGGFSNMRRGRMNRRTVNKPRMPS